MYTECVCPWCNYYSIRGRSDSSAEAAVVLVETVRKNAGNNDQAGKEPNGQNVELKKAQHR